MKSYVKLLLLVALVALMMPLVLGYGIGPIGASHPNTIGDHARSKTIANYTCNGCHNRMIRNESTDPNHLAAHRRHFASAFLNFIESTNTANSGCGDCHQETVYENNSYPTNDSNNGVGLGSGYEGDLSYTDTDTVNTTATFARAARKQVKPDACESCHGAFPKGKHDGVNLAKTAPRDCVTSSCHNTTAHSDRHAAATYINSRYANSSTFCARCHGELAWFETTETTLTLPQ